MGNKLQTIFSTHMFDLGGNIRFRDIESSRKFADALDLVYEQGQTVEVDGIETISIRIKQGDMEYPAATHKPMGKIVIAPARESIPINIQTKSGTKAIILNRYQTKNEIIIETDLNAIVYLKLSVKKQNIETPTMNFIYRMQLKNAKRIKDISESLHDTLGIMRALLGPLDAQNIKDGKEEFIKMIKSFQFTELYFDKLYALEEKLNITFDPQKATNINDEANDVYELYLLLIEKKPVRLNAKLTATTSTGITIVDDSFEHKVGGSLCITFSGEATYTICGQEIHIYTANLLTNAIVKEIKTDSAGTTNILYGDTDSNPMYISYRGFTTKSAETRERKKIMNHKAKYESAQTVEKYIAQCNEQFH